MYNVIVYMGKEMGWMKMMDGSDPLNAPLRFQTEELADQYMAALAWEKNKCIYEVIEEEDDYDEWQL